MKHCTGIEWTHFPGYTGAAWNPYVGCSRVSPGCQHCYAERQAWRIVVQARGAGRSSPYEGAVEVVGGAPCRDCSGVGEFPRARGEAIRWCGRCWGFGRVGGEPRWTGEVHDAGKLDLPLRTKKPHAFFVNSMSDLFHESVTDEQIAAVFGVAAACPQHVFVILTKRSDRVPRWMEWIRSADDGIYWTILNGVMTSRGLEGEGEAPGPLCNEIAWPLPNVFIGPSVEDQQRADERMPHAMALAEAGWRVVVSYEPALGTVEFDGHWHSGPGWLRGYHAEPVHACRGDESACRACPEAQQTQNGKISWLITGAESGPDRRPFDPAWIPAADCAAAGVPLFVKQGSAHRPGQQGNIPDDLWAIKQFPEVHT